MSAVPQARPALFALRPKRSLVGASVVAALAAAAMAGRWEGPDLGLLARQPPVLQAHIYAALAALALGGALMAGRKGARLHRLLGWIWTALMGTAAVASLFVVGLAGDHWSFIHLFTALTLVALPAGLVAARRHDIKRHRRTMMGLFYGGLVITGALTFIPGRLMWQVVFG